MLKLTKEYKIVLVANVARDLYNFRIGLIRALRDHGFEIVSVAPKDNFEEKFIEEGVKFISCEYLRREEKNLFKNLILVLKLFKIYKNEKPDLVIHYTIKPNIFGNIASKLANVRSLSVVTGLGTFFIKKNFIQYIIRYLYKFSFLFTEKVFFLNEDDMQLFIKFKIINKDKAVFINSEGINIDYFSPEYCNEIAKRDNKDNLVFLMIARLIWDKGVGEFVESAKRIKEKYNNVEFWLLGPIDRANPNAIPCDIINNWENMGIIKYLGTANDVRPFISMSDVVVLPSYYREGVPRSLLEAISMGKPVITTNTPGCREVVEDGVNGFLVPVKDIEALTKAMIEFINLPQEEKIKMGESSRRIAVRKFDEKIVIERYLQVIKEILGL